MNDDLIKIRVVLGPRILSLTIKREEEEIFRKAAKNITDKVLEYQKRYEAHDDLMDFVAITALQNTVALLELKANRETENILKEIKEINHTLESHLLAN